MGFCFRDLYRGFQPGLIVRILEDSSGVVNGLLMCSLGVVDLIPRGRFLELMRARLIEKSHCFLGNLAGTIRENLMMSLCEGTGWVC